MDRQTQTDADRQITDAHMHTHMYVDTNRQTQTDRQTADRPITDRQT